MSDFPVHTGRRKRDRRAAEIEAMRKRSPGSRAERERATQLYAPQPEWTGQCRYCPSRFSTRWELEEHERRCYFGRD